MSKMDLNQMLIFAKIAEYQSFTKAAKSLNMDKSTVSNKLSQLESHLGVRLLNRSTRSVTLTEAGAGYFQYCQQIIETAQEAEQFTATLGNDAVGLLRIAASNEFGDVFIRKLIQPFMQENPKLEIEMVLDYRNVDLVKENFDVALRVGVGAGTLDDSNLIAKKLLEDEVGFFCSPAFIDERGKLEKVDQVNSFDFVGFSLASPHDFVIKQGDVSHQLELTGKFKVNDVLSTKVAAISGLGIAVLPRFVVADEIENKQLIPLLTAYTFPAFNVYAVYPSRQWMPAKLKVFLGYISENMKHLN